MLLNDVVTQNRAVCRTDVRWWRPSRPRDFHTNQSERTHRIVLITNSRDMFGAAWIRLAYFFSIYCHRNSTRNTRADREFSFIHSSSFFIYTSLRGIVLWITNLVSVFLRTSLCVLRAAVDSGGGEIFVLPHAGWIGESIAMQPMAPGAVASKCESARAVRNADCQAYLWLHQCYALC